MDNGLAERLAGIQARIEAACSRVGRASGSVRILAISKTHAPAAVRAVMDLGMTDFGESRVQEAVKKIGACPGAAVWHLVGHLQTNKVREAARLFQMIHSLDSLKLARSLQVAADAAGRTLPVMLQVNLAGESSKFGLAPGEVPDLLGILNEMPRLEAVGLMTIPPWVEDPESARPWFRELRMLRDQLRADGLADLPELSMGMSHDFEIAIEEGATWVRIGTALFGTRERAG